MAYSGETLTSEDLDLWRDYELAIWIIEFSNDDEDYGFQARRHIYTKRRDFLADLYNVYNLEEDKEIYVSEITGHIYYEED